MSTPFADFARHFLNSLWLAVPWLLLGALVSGVLAVFLKPVDSSRPRRPWLTASIGALIGLALPLGEYAVVPVARRLLRKGVSLAAVVALLLAGPALTPIALAASVSALHDHASALVLSRALVMAIAAMLTGALVGWRAGQGASAQGVYLNAGKGLKKRVALPSLPHPHSALTHLVTPSPCMERGQAERSEAGGEVNRRNAQSVSGITQSDFTPGEPILRAWRRALALGLRDFLALLPWLVLGALLAAGVRTAIAPHDLETLARGQAGEALPLAARAYLLPADSLGDAELARNLAGVYSQRAVLALLVVGSTDLLGTALWLSTLRRRVALLTLALAWLIAAPLVFVLGEEHPVETPSRAALSSVVFLGPADAYARNLYLARPDTGTITPLLDTPVSIEDFAPAPDGTQIAFTRDNDDGTADLWLLDVRSGTTRRLTHCMRARCSSPAWHPDGTQIAYQRQDFSAAAGHATRVWVVEVSTAQSRLLFDDPQRLGADPLWSPDGQRIAIYDAAARGIRVHDLQTGQEVFLASEPGDTGAFAPDGTRLVYPFLVRGALGQEFYTHLALADLSAESQLSLSGEQDAPVEDAFAAWSPDGTRLALARRYLDERYTAGKQIYLLDVTTGTATPLVVDVACTHAAPQWDSSGRWIAYQRFSLNDPNAQPEIWVFDTQTGQARLLAENAFFPAWLPAGQP